MFVLSVADSNRDANRLTQFLLEQQPRATTLVTTYLRILPQLGIWPILISELGSVESGALFTLKCMMQTHPFILIFASYLASIPFFGYMLRIAEMPVARADPSLPTYTYANAMWNAYITIATGKTWQLDQLFTVY